MTESPESLPTEVPKGPKPKEAGGAKRGNRGNCGNWKTERESSPSALARKRALEQSLSRLEANSALETLEALCEARLRERAYLFDAAQLTSHSLARITDRPEREDVPRIAWILDRIDLALDDLLVEEQGTQSPNGEPISETFEMRMMGLGIEPDMISRSARRFNGLAERYRQAYFLMVIDPDVLDELYPLGTDYPEALLEDTRTALRNVLVCRPADEPHGPGPKHP